MESVQGVGSHVQDIMIEPVSVIESTETVRAVKRRLGGETVRSLIVLEGFRPIGIVTQRSILGVEDDEPVTEHMDSTFPLLTPRMTVEEAQERQLAEHDTEADYDRVPVVDDNTGRIVGEVAREALYHLKRVSHGDQEAALASSPVQAGMDVVSVDDDKLGTVDDLIFSGADLDSFTVKHGLLGRKHKRLQSDLISGIDGDKVVVKIGKQEFNMLADIEDMEVEA